MQIDSDAHLFQLALEVINRCHRNILSDDDAADIQTDAGKGINESQHVLVIGDAQVAAQLALFNVMSIDYDYYLNLVSHACQHSDLDVWLETRKNSGSMIVVKQLAAEFQIQLVVKSVDSFHDLGRLHLNVFLIIECYFIHRAHLQIHFNILT